MRGAKFYIGTKPYPHASVLDHVPQVQHGLPPPATKLRITLTVSAYERL